jgi:hypothetical protein
VATYLGPHVVAGRQNNRIRFGPHVVLGAQVVCGRNTLQHEILGLHSTLGAQQVFGADVVYSIGPFCIAPLPA